MIFPVSVFRTMSQVGNEFFSTLKRQGEVGNMLGGMMTRADLYKTVGYYDYES